ncbi:hypothetical protein ACFWIQ_23870 [Kitasatospora sp. NPDC127059]|uniref:hypothetical protein n=1 Tax=unclassified Kitasatospora TaxID=2633591 RepID=UPI0036501F6C
MTSLHPTSTDLISPYPDPDPASTDPDLPGPAAGGAGTPPTGGASTPATADGPPAPAGPPGPPAPAVPVCSLATATEGTQARHDSVPQPRTPEDVEAQLRHADGDATAAGLRAALAERLRTGRAEGRSLAELAASCRRPVEEVRALLGETAEQAPVLTGSAPVEQAGSGFLRLQQAATPSEANRPAPAPRSTREEIRSLASRRPSPSRRLRRMHPQTDRTDLTGQEATARETAATDPTGVRPQGAGRVGEPTGATGASAERALLADAWTGPESPAVAPEYGGGTAWAGASRTDTSWPGMPRPDTSWPGPSGPDTSWGEAPLGILIGGSPVQPEALGRPEERTPVRVAAEPIRVGRGTSLVVLPSWRPAIAVSVSTEQLVTETGLAVGQLADAQLTVRMNPWALHDRELDLHGWEPGPPRQSGQSGPNGRTPRRGGGRG